LLIVATVFCGLVAILYAISATVLLDGFQQIEESNLRDEGERGIAALTFDVNELAAAASDWARWDDAYEFVARPTEGFVRENLLDQTFRNLRLNLIMFVNPAGQIVFAKGFDRERDVETPVSHELLARARSGDKLFRHEGPDARVQGVLLVDGRPMLVASLPILPSDGDGPVRGALIWGRAIDAGEISRLAKITQFSLHVRSVLDPNLPEDFRVARAGLTRHASLQVFSLNPHVIAAYVLVHDIYGRPSLVMRLDAPRYIYQQGQLSVRYFVFCLVLVGGVLGVVMVLLTDRLVLTRLDALNRQVTQIADAGDVSARVAVASHDELSTLGNSINRMLRALERSEAALRYQALIIDQIHDSVVATDLEGHVTAWNRGAENLFGWPAEEIIGRHVSIAFPEDQREALQQTIVARLKEKGAHDLEVCLLRKNGEKFFAHLSLSWQRDATGNVVGVIGYAVDVTERKRLEQQFMQSQKAEAIGRLAGGVAHDFNNILTAIMGFCDLQRMSLPANHRVVHFTEEIQKAADRAASLTRQLLAYSRKQVLQPRVLDLNAVVAGTEKMLRRLIGADIEVVSVLADNLGPVKADPVQIEQVLMNLAVNARDAMPGGGKLTLQTANVSLLDGEYVLLAVGDTGTGMTEEVKAHLFEPFFTTKPKGQGTGLGLATCYGIVQQSQGQIAVDSAPGRGTTVKVFLPRVEAAVDEAAPKRERGAEPPHGSETVLVAEDEPVVRELTVAALRDLGYNVLEAANGEEALRVAQRHNGNGIQMLFTDVVMPLMGGKELADQFGRLYPEVRVLFTSGYTENAIERDGVLDARTAFLQKPYTTSVLAHKIREVLDN
jgi:PAS domain S-box-containing protein